MLIRAINYLIKNNDGNIPTYLLNNIHYGTIVGDISVGILDNNKQIDIYLVSSPSKQELFPNNDYVSNLSYFSNKRYLYQKKNFIFEDFILNINCYTLPAYFRLLMNNISNIIESAFTKENHVFIQDSIGKIIRDNRQLYLNKKFAKRNFMGKYKYLVDKVAKTTSINEFNYDTYNTYKAAQIILEYEQILKNYDIDLDRNGELLYNVKHGKYSLSKIKEWKRRKEENVEKLFNETDLRETVNKKVVLNDLMLCLKIKYPEIVI